jgi:dolichyl-phosphate-mannose-protein mannosyltransferase
MARIATLDSQVTAYVVAAWLAALSVFFHAGEVAQGVSRSKTLGRVWLGATGLLLGFAIATKWVGLYSLGVIALLLFADVVVRRSRGIAILFPSRLVAVAGLGAAVIVVPLAIYFLSYLPYLSLGHSFGDVLALQKEMYDYHAGVTGSHPYSSQWYGWPIGHKAVALWTDNSGTETAGISAIANPVVFIGGLLGMTMVATAAWRRRMFALAALPLAALTHFLPWVLVSRYTFLYHYLPVVPFLAIALAWGLAARSGNSRWARYETGVVAAAAVAMFALLLPVLDGWYTSPEFHDSLRSWLSWLF